MFKKTVSFLTLIIYFVFSQTAVIQAQTKQIELKDIWSNRVFSSEMVYGINPLKDGHTYAIIEEKAINVYDYATGDFLKQLVSFEKLIPEGSDKSLSIRSYTLSEDETKILFPTETEAIYRHSTRSLYYIYDISTDKLTQLSVNGMQQLATFSPDGNNIAFVRDNNLFVKDLSSNVEQQITFDGKSNEIINGTTDWVYEEEFSFTQAFFWSDDSKKIAFYRMDESKVKEFQMTYFNELYPEEYRYKYPKAGEDNSVVSIHVWNSTTNETILMDIGSETDIYIPRIAWTRNPNELSIQRMNRIQNHLEILIANSETGNSRLLYEEKNPYYIDITDNLSFLSDNKHFLITSEKDGFNHIYLYDLSGKLVKQLTNGNFDITSLYGFSQKYKKVYFQSAETSPLDRNIYSVDLKGKIESLTTLNGQNSATFSTDFSFFINTNSTINTPPFITVNKNNGKQIRVLKDNEKLKKTLSEYQIGKFEFFTISDTAIKLPDGQLVALNGWKLLPSDFDPNKKYPVMVYIYGGPGSQTVNNAWGGSNNLWFQLLAQKGIIVVSVDNRGTGARGEIFKKMTYKELGKFETEDLITTAKYLSSLNFIDSSKLSVFGWSYGGYMSSLAITKGADYFSTAIAVAPVTNWRYYDNIYTERYMQLPKENEKGYDFNSPINHVDKIKGNYLLIHGSADDNVHYQNTMEMINALVAADKQFELMIYPNKNHGIYGGNTRMHLYELMTGFLEKNLLK